MTDPTDDLMRRLTAANPVDPRLLPSANDPSAQQLLENTMNASEPSNSNPDNPVTDNPVTMIDAHGNRYISSQGADGTGLRASGPEVADLSDHLSGTANKRFGSRGRLVGAAAAVLLLVGGLLVLAPENTPSAVATVHSAAAATADSDTGRTSTVFSFQSDTDPADNVEGRLDSQYSGSDATFSIQAEGQIDGSDELPFTDARLVDDILYIDLDGQWTSVDTQGFLGQVVSEFVDPRGVLANVQEITEITEVGPATLDGVQTTHYTSTVDLGDESLGQSGWLAVEGMDIETEGEIEVDLYIDGDGVLTQLNLSGTDVQETDGDESGSFEVTMSFFDIGDDIVIEAPADAEPFSMLDGLLED